ncbi:zinc finger BED domain-containing protein RICESLEEPER 2-like [Ananas comosus]|uniref:Zinc finger BED domain-containing protein RICESLEEPER 2-like n=1 Tax=Ananas comosus TaxID=4615 RepID=A0A6P5H0R3_ANACO|nr:zinc finger BED domain-containing protein RICESLEEPER 2-like [Ananas comosus]
MSSPTLPHPNSSQQSASFIGTNEPCDTQEKDETADNHDMDEVENELEGKKIRKKVSKVWEYFEEVEVLENKVLVKKLKCKYCTRKYSKSKTGTTSQLKRHMNECFYLKNQPKDQGLINFPPSEALENEVEFSPVYIGSSFDAFKIREIMAKMIIVHEYPFTMVEHTWFNILCKALNPNFQKVSRNTIKNECLKAYETEKEKLKKVLKNVDKISLTCDCWTSKQTIGYMALTAHYIDSEWQLQKRVIAFIELEPPHTGLVISDAISECLLDWGIQDKVSTITLDNASSNDVAAKSLRLNFERRNKLHFKGMFFHIRCCAHVLNLMVQDGLKEIAEIINDIRESVKYFKKSPGRLQKFGEIAKQLGLSTERGLSSDVTTRWNSTYKMLDAAFHYKLVFSEYANRDPYYPTSNKFLRETYKVKKVLAEQATSDDYFMRNMARVMAENLINIGVLATC